VGISGTGVSFIIAIYLHFVNSYDDPNHQLLRQQHPGDWPGVIAAAAERLREIVSNHSPSRSQTFNQLSAKAQSPTSPEAVA
jgi:hypothetical protein